MEKKPVSPIKMQPYFPAPIAPIQQPESPQIMPMPMPAPEYVLPQQCPPYPMQPICCPPIFNPCCPPIFNPCCPPIFNPCCPPIFNPCGCIGPMHHQHHFFPQYQPYFQQGQSPWGY
jgi:hypothetical protein